MFEIWFRWPCDRNFRSQRNIVYLPRFSTQFCLFFSDGSSKLFVSLNTIDVEGIAIASFARLLSVFDMFLVGTFSTTNKEL